MGQERPQPQIARPGLLPHQWTRVEDPATVAVVAAYDTIIAGGGPAGLTGAFELSKHGKPCVVLESDARLVGGISRTDQYKGYRFDIGGHRFFSKSEEVNRLWHEILGDELLDALATEPDLLRSKILPLSAQACRCTLEARAVALVSDRGELPEGKARPDQSRAELRGLGGQSLRPRAVRDLFQVVYREGLGDADLRHLGRLGRPADQGPEFDSSSHIGSVRPFWLAAR